MIKSAHLLTLQQAQRALAKHGETDLAEALADMVTEELTARTNAGRKATSRTEGAGGRPPTTRFIIELEPGWSMEAIGITAAHAALEEALAEVGALALLPKKTSLGVSLNSAANIWWKTVDTDNGVVTVSVRRLA
jgi:hypothetical protein